MQRKRIQCENMCDDSYQARLQNVQDPVCHGNIDPLLSKMTESLTAVTAESYTSSETLSARGLMQLPRTDL